MRDVQVSDDPAVVWLSPERCRAARAVLNWSPGHLARLATKRMGEPVSAAEIREFEDFGLMLDTFTMAAVLAILLEKVELTPDDAEPGVIRKRNVRVVQGAGYVQFGGPLRRRPPL